MKKNGLPTKILLAVSLTALVALVGAWGSQVDGRLNKCEEQLARLTRIETIVELMAKNDGIVLPPRSSSSEP